MDKQAISALINSQKEQFALDQKFYTDANIYERDITEIFLKSWLYAGHISEIPNSGDWFLFELDGESVIIIRSKDDSIHALLNVCRHRGSKICLQQKGCDQILVCPYHAWGYGTDGNLLAAPHMGENFDKSAMGLKKIHLEILDGLIYINFAEQPSSFSPIQTAMSDCLEPYDLTNAKVAHRKSYLINGNWKLSVENYTECYHCAPSHPEYSRGHSLAKPNARSTDLMKEVLIKSTQCGLKNNFLDRYFQNAEGFGADYGYERYPMWRGHVTGSEDGQGVAPLMGSISGYDGGTTDFQIGPVCFALAYCDYIVIYRFTPISLTQSECDITWLVNGDAVEGKDYDLKRLIWLWDVTTIADKRIIESNALGVNSRFYEPGPLSTMEYFTWTFLSWYIEAIKPD